MKYIESAGTIVAAVCLSLCGALSVTAAELSSDLNADLASLTQRFDQLQFATSAKRERRNGFEQLLEQANDLVAAHPDSVEALTWKGIVLSTYAGEASMFSAMKYANAARQVLHLAESIDPTALNGGVYTSLGALYAHVPGGMIGFGDTELASEYLRKALSVSPDSLDANYFLAELLIAEGADDEARRVLNQGLSLPVVASRPIFDEGRRSQMRTMLSDL